MERTLSIIKPDAVGKNKIGEIIKRFESEGLKIVALKMVHLSKQEAERFYEVHKEKPFYGSLTDFMSSGPCVPLVLEGDKAIERTRKVMGATDPAKADSGTIRKDFAQSIEKNAVHGSDALQTAKTEKEFFFPELK